jgi:hypothetical protein
MKHALLVCLLACSKPDEMGALRDRAIAIAHANQPALVAQVARITALKQRMRGNLPGWEPELRVAQLASDELGLPPFEQTVPPGPEWKPSPASLLGIAPYVEARAKELASANRGDELRFLVQDEQARYQRGLTEVSARLDEVEHWLDSTTKP